MKPALVERAGRPSPNASDGLPIAKARIRSWSKSDARTAVEPAAVCDLAVPRRCTALARRRRTAQSRSSSAWLGPRELKRHVGDLDDRLAVGVDQGVGDRRMARGRSRVP